MNKRGISSAPRRSGGAGWLGLFKGDDLLLLLDKQIKAELILTTS
jgi:hypothetical protein